ncbi:hypothetical protein SAMN05444673_3841 [Bacillus sp. OV166]|nr:hypothetical protein SAMN05444673_3841 [Bacillus sp. OV166]
MLEKYLRFIYSYFVLLLDNSIDLKPTAFDIHFEQKFKKLCCLIKERMDNL